jgi:hypothetical protein
MEASSANLVPRANRADSGALTCAVTGDRRAVYSWPPAAPSGATLSMQPPSARLHYMTERYGRKVRTTRESLRDLSSVRHVFSGVVPAETVGLGDPPPVRPEPADMRADDGTFDRADRIDHHPRQLDETQEHRSERIAP